MKNALHASMFVAVNEALMAFMYSTSEFAVDTMQTVANLENHYQVRMSRQPKRESKLFVTISGSCCRPDPGLHALFSVTVRFTIRIGIKAVFHSSYCPFVTTSLSRPLCPLPSALSLIFVLPSSDFSLVQPHRPWFSCWNRPATRRHVLRRNLRCT